MIFVFLVFFFKQKTAYEMRISDWSSDVCSSDLVVRGRKGEYRKEMAEWQKAGFTRVRIDGQFYDMEDAPALDKKYKHDIEVVVDRLVVREGIETRLADSLETALKLSEGLVYMDPADPSPSRSREGLGEGLDRKSTRLNSSN